MLQTTGNFSNQFGVLCYSMMKPVSSKAISAVKSTDAGQPSIPQSTSTLMWITSRQIKAIKYCGRATRLTYLGSQQLLLLPDRRHNEAMLDEHQLKWKLVCTSTEPTQILRDKSTVRRPYKLLALQNWAWLMRLNSDTFPERRRGSCKWFHSKFALWTKSQAGLVSCLEPWKNVHWAVKQNKCLSSRTARP